MTEQATTETWEQKRDRENAERVDKINSINARLKQIVRLLGFQVEAEKEPNTWNAGVTAKKGDAGFYFTVGTYDLGWDRVSVRGNYPSGKDRQYVTVYEQVEKDGRKTWEEIKCPSITVSLSKSNEQIAKDVTRRFIPDYEKRLEAVIKKVREENEYELKTLDGVRLLKKTLTGRSILSDYERSSKQIAEYVGPKGDGDYQVRCEAKVSGESVKLEIGNLLQSEAAVILGEIVEIIEKSRKGLK